MSNLATLDYALVSVRSMADTESDRLELALENLFLRHCSGKSAPKSKEYCGEFCKVRYDEKHPFVFLFPAISIGLPWLAIRLASIEAVW